MIPRSVPLCLPAAFLALTVTSAAAPPQTQNAPPIYMTDFSTLDGWTVTTDCLDGFEWAADATPSTPVGALDPFYIDAPNFTPFVSAPASLNFNNGTWIGNVLNFGTGNITCGMVTSPPIDLSATPRVPVLRFMAGGFMEGGCDYDVLSLRVRSAGGGAAHLEVECLPLTGSWELFEYELDSAWGAVEIEFDFTTVDGITNDGPGPFIDDLEIIDRCSVGPMSPCDDFVSFCFGDGSGTACPCGNNSALGEKRGCRNSSGEGARLLPSGTPESGNDDLRFQLEGAPAISFAFLVSADNALPMLSPTTPVGWGIQDKDGLRCIGGNLIRHGARATDLAGSSGFSNPGWGPPNNPTGGIVAQGGFVSGQTRYFQIFVRDDVGQVCGFGGNRSNAIKVTFR